MELEVIQSLTELRKSAFLDRIQYVRALTSLHYFSWRSLTQLHLSIQEQTVLTNLRWMTILRIPEITLLDWNPVYWDVSRNEQKFWNYYMNFFPKTFSKQFKFGKYSARKTEIGHLNSGNLLYLLKDESVN